MSNFLAPQNYEPMRKNRFLIIFPEKLGIHPFYARSINLPTAKVITSVVSSFFSHKQFDRVDFTDCKIKLMPTCDNKILKKLFDLQSKFEKINVRVQMLDPTAVVIEEYQLLGTFLKEIKIEELDYGNSDPVYYDLTLSVDYVTIDSLE